METAFVLPSPSPVNLWVVLSESKRIINAHSRHFLALSILFLLPPFFFVAVYQSAASHNSVSLLRDDQPHEDNETMVWVLLLIVCIVVSNVFNLFAFGSISYSVFQGFYGRPVKLISAVKSSFTSFFPLLATQIFANFIIFGIILIVGFAAFLLTLPINLILPGVEFSSFYFQALFVILMIIFVVIVMKLSVNWILAWVVVVVESVWGLTPLKRSKSLIKGRKGVSLSLILIFGLTQLILVWMSMEMAKLSSAQLDDNEIDETAKLWTKAFFLLLIVITSAYQTLVGLYSLAATTVMYIYCKGDLTEEFAEEYVSLPFDNGKVPDLVSVAYNNV